MAVRCVLPPFGSFTTSASPIGECTVLRGGHDDGRFIARLASSALQPARFLKELAQRTNCRERYYYYCCAATHKLRYHAAVSTCCYDATLTACCTSYSGKMPSLSNVCSSTSRWTSNI
eukprot:10820-Heterococcus_DN1.PRE.9